MKYRREEQFRNAKKIQVDGRTRKGRKRVGRFIH